MPIRASALPRVPPLFAHLALVVALIAIAASAVPTARAADPGRPGRADELLVRYRSTSTPAQRREVARLYGLTGLGADASGRTEVVVAPGRSPAAVERKLRADPAILAVAPNHRRELALDPSAEPEIGEEWGMRNTGQRIVGIEDVAGSSGVDIDGLEALRYGVGSSNVVVAVIDDGIDFNHPDLGQRAWTNPGEAGALAANGIDDDGNGYIDDVNGWDFCNDDNTVHDPGEDGHGTHVAGTIAASLDGQGVVGVAPGVRLMALKFIDDSVQCGLDSMAVEAIDYAASFGIRIINASWGGEAPSTVIDAAIASSGALFVAAAGNDGRDLDRSDGYRFYPASSNLANVISVAAIDQTGHLAEFSNYGRRSVDLAAPGTNILSTWPADGDCSAWCYAWNAGTSMAVPHVSGAAALVASHRPSLLVDPIGLRARLMARGRTMPATAGLTVTGRMLNVLRVIDFVAPRVTAPTRFGIGIGTIVGRTDVSAIVRWPAGTDDRSGLGAYDVRRHGPTGWKTVSAATKSTMVDTTLSYGSAYIFRLRAKDKSGNLSGPIDSPAVTATLHRDSSSLATYGSGWSTRSSVGATNGSVHTASRAGASMRFGFTGRSVALVATRGRSRGSVKVYLDGAYLSTVDLYRTTTLSKVVVFSKTWENKATHSLRLVVAGTAGHPRVDIDGFVVVR